MRAVRSELEVNESDVGAAYDEGDDPDDEDHQESVAGGEARGERVDDAHVPEWGKHSFQVLQAYKIAHTKLEQDTKPIEKTKWRNGLKL